MVLEIRHPEIGSIKTVGIPVKLEGTPGDVRRAPPKLGEHTREVLGSLLGLGDGELDRLAAQKII